MAGVNTVYMPYKGGTSATTALLAGEVQVMFSRTTSFIQQVNSGHVKRWPPD